MSRLPAKWVAAGLICTGLSMAMTEIVHAEDGKNLLQIGVGGNAYRGDLGGSFKKWRATFYAGLRFNRKERLNGSLQVALGSLTGQTSDPEYPGDPDKTPNRYFRSSILAVNYELHFNIIKNERIIWYIGQGFGVMHYNPKDESGKELRDRSDTRPEGESYGSVTVFLPTKMGSIYFLPNALGIGVEAGLYNALTDFMDNISGWGTRSGNDNALYIRLFLNIPVRI